MLVLDLQPDHGQRRAILFRTVAPGVREAFAFEVDRDSRYLLGVSARVIGEWNAERAVSMPCDRGEAVSVTIPMQSGRVVSLRFGWQSSDRGPILRCRIDAPRDVEIIREQTLFARRLNRGQWLRYDPRTMAGAASGARASA